MNLLKRIFALLAALIVLALPVTAAVVSFIDIPYQEAIIKSCLFSTLFIAVFVGVSAALFRMLKKLNSLKQNEDTTDQ